jgi:ribosomal 50S subunit-recycling heat shock protein
MLRLDVFLKNAGLVKQRSSAKRACDEGCVQVDQQPAKASREVRVGDVIAIDSDTEYLRVEVLGLPQRSVAKKQRQDYYRVLERQHRDPGADLRF